jgi:hypothetical protein
LRLLRELGYSLGGTPFPVPNFRPNFIVLAYVAIVRDQVVMATGRSASSNHFRASAALA